MKNTDTFGVYPRKMRSGKTVFYYWAYERGGRRVYRSTRTDTYEQAVRYCRNLLKTGKLAVERKYLFSEYTADFFRYDVCPYIKSRLLHGKSYTRSWARKQRRLLESRITPELGRTDILEITGGQIESWIYRIIQEGAGPKTINHLITILRIIFGYAMKRRDIQENPMDRVEAFALKTAEKGILTRDELSRLFSGDAVWDSKLHFALNFTAAITGMRLGELRALKFSALQPNVVIVSRAWNPVDGEKETKTGKVRRIPIPEKLYELLLSLKTTGEDDAYIFSRGLKPIDHKTVYKHFYKALANIGIGKSERVARNITFHSYRHGFNTLLLEAGIAPEMVRLLTGHSAGMTARYSHVQLANISYSLPLCVPAMSGGISFSNTPATNN